MAKKGRVYTHQELQAKIHQDYAGMCGVLSRACSVLGIPWHHDEELADYESQIKALDKWLTRKQHGYDTNDLKGFTKLDNVVDGVEVPFG